MWKRIRTYLATGLFVILPAFITGYLLWVVFTFTDNLMGSLLEVLIGRRIPGLGLVALLFLFLLAGMIAANYLGKRVIRWAESLLARVPVIGGIYGTTRQFTEALSSPERGVFRRVVMVEYPRAGIYTLGFLTGQAPRALEQACGKKLANVFIPTPPNPTTGFLIHVPVEEVIYPSISVDEGVKFAISAGVVKPASCGSRDAGEA
ncbi:MAG: DUF502 domain-containing protein [Bacteroidota bacterium]